MKSILKAAGLALVLLSVVALAGESKVKIGVLALESFTGQNELANKVTESLASKLSEMGFYEVNKPEALSSGLAEVHIKMPRICRDPRCVLDIGRALQMDRMIYGSVDVNSEKSGIRLFLIDVVMGLTVEQVSIEGVPGSSADDVLSAAVARIHGLTEKSAVKEYYGPQINNLKQLIISSSLVQGSGLVYNAFNYGVGGVKSDAQYLYVDDPLSGIASSADQIPMFARPAALANAYVAASDDAYGVLYNPAGMAWVAGQEVAAGYQHRFGIDLLAVSYANKATREIGFGNALFYSADRDGALAELYFATALAYRFNQNLLLRPFSVGATVKLSGSSVKQLSLDSPEGNSFGAGIDLGFMWELNERIRYGLLLRDVPFVNRWKNKTTGERYYEANASTLHMGGSFKAGYAGFLIAEGQIPLHSDQPWIMSGGIEYEMYRLISLRVGLQREILNEEATWWKLTGGLGFRLETEPVIGRELHLDAAYEYNTLTLFPVVNVSVRAGF